MDLKKDTTVRSTDTAARQPAVPTIVPLDCRQHQTSGDWDSRLQLHIGRNYRIAIPNDFDPQTLEKLLCALECFA